MDRDKRDETKPLVSVIVPVYNVEAYLERCLDSLLVQTLQDIEIIVIDDGSTDNSGEICDLYATRDKRIQVVHKENEGLSIARNKGIDLSRADYIMFVDSDDWVAQDFCLKSYNMAVNNDSDLVVFSWKEYRNGRIKNNPTINCQEGIISNKQAIGLLYENGLWPAWNKLYARRLFDTVSFPEGKVYEDIVFTFRVFEIAERIFFTNENLYYYVTGRPGSITNTSSPNSLNDFLYMQTQKSKLFSKWGYDSEMLMEKEFFSHLIRFGHAPEKANDQIVDRINRIKGFPDTFSSKQKIMLLAWRVSPKLFDLMCIAMGRRITND